MARLKGGETAKVTTLPQSPRSIVWSPDGKHIAFTRFVPSPAPTLADMPAKPKGAKWAEPATVVDRMTFRFDWSGGLPTFGNRQPAGISSCPQTEIGTPRQMTCHGGLPDQPEFGFVDASQPVDRLLKQST